MKAAVNLKYGPPAEVVHIEEVDKPTPMPNEILIKVHASSVNRSDCGFVRAKPFVTRFFSGMFRPRNQILGCEFAGEVVECGSNVDSFKLGDRVFGFDDSRWGGHGEFKVIDVKRMVAKIPDNISFDVAAVSSEGGHYALSYLWSMRIGKGDRVLIHGATGAIGSAAVQLFKQAGAYVVATADTNNVELVEKLRADRVIDRVTEDFTQCGETFDVVFDSVGKSSFRDCKKLLVKRGLYVATELGKWGQNPLLAIVSPLFRLVRAKRVTFPLPKANHKVIEHLRDRLADGTFVPVIDRTYPLDRIVDAYAFVETGQKVGNVLIAHE
ncbi:MAG TPA: NAD(P)-dependent alcohol dehydrogenase [Acidimicrobiia bacterium]|nr:NAD(P)-dependent alcohol dehydrogenase [Acidimicrobiia bacterium]